jgi:CheY-like chemotaxis protein
LTKGYLYDPDDDDEAQYDIEIEGYNYGESFGYEVFEAINGDEELQGLFMNVSSPVDDEVKEAPRDLSNKQRSEFGEGDVDLWDSDDDWDDDDDEDWESDEVEDPDELANRPPQKLYRTEESGKSIPSSTSMPSVHERVDGAAGKTSISSSTAAAGSISLVLPHNMKAGSAEPTARPTIHLLIVDDSLVQRKVTRNKLSGDMGKEVWLVNTAESGERAMQVFNSSATLPDVMIIDQNMISAGGEMLGHEFVAKIRKNPAFRRTIIIGCTAFAEEAKSKMLAAGCDAVWTKPMPSKEQMYAQIQEIRKQKMLL